MRSRALDTKISLALKQNKDGQPTLRQNADSLAKIAGLTISSLGIFQHTYDKTQFTKKTVLSGAVGRDMGFRKASHRKVIVKHLQKGVGIGIEDMSFESTEVSFVVEAEGILSYLRKSKHVSLLTQSRNLQRQTLNTRSLRDDISLAHHLRCNRIQAFPVQSRDK